MSCLNISKTECKASSSMDVIFISLSFWRQGMQLNHSNHVWQKKPYCQIRNLVPCNKGYFKKLDLNHDKYRLPIKGLEMSKIMICLRQNSGFSSSSQPGNYTRENGSNSCGIVSESKGNLSIGMTKHAPVKSTPGPTYKNWKDSTNL